MKLRRDISGEELAKLLKKFGYEITRQTHLKGEHHIPKHKPLKVGTLNSILRCC